MSIAVCTIVAKNYLAIAKTLADSLQAFHPLIDFHILVIDPFELSAKQLELGKMTLDSPTDFIETAKFKTLANEYNITELSTAVKPFYLEHLLQCGYEKAIYFDPDILILQPIDQIFQALDTSNIILIPHLLDPIPLDGCLPTEITLLQAGAYNLGFIGVAQSHETHRFLAWWGERLEKYCRVAVAEGLFVDQKWIDLVPGMFEKVQILTARGYDVAYWNLNARHLSKRDGVYWVDDEPLVFFHFSGFNPDCPTQLSKHQNRLKVKALPTLANLLQDYASLLKANGHDEYKQLSYGYSTFSNGVPIDDLARSLLKEAQRVEMSFPNPYNVDAEPSFFKWLNSPVTKGNKHTAAPHITNYLFGLHQIRLDLQTAFPDVLGQHRNDYLAWVTKDATSQGVHPAYLDAAYADIKGSALSSWVAPSGVNVAGYLTAEMGVGEAARGYVTALKSLGVQTALTDFATGTPSRKEDNTLSGFSSTNPYQINLICINADQVPIFINHVGSHYLEQKHNIGVWWWELPDFPEEWRDRFAYFNELWVGSAYTYESVSRNSPIPVVKIPPVVHMQLPHVYQKEHFGLAGSEFIFLFVFDFFGYFERKNPLAVVEAFKKAFLPDEPVRLVLKCINGEHDPVNFNRLEDAIDDARITLIKNYWSKDEKNGLVNACDCYISLHRSEGFGLTLAEAMLLEKPVIATGWSGNMDFMTVNNSYLVEHELTSIKVDYGPYKQGQIWAEPSIQHAAQLMRRVYEQPEEANKKAKRAAADIRLMHSPAAVAEVVKARLDVIQSLLSISAGGKMIQQDIPQLPLGTVSIPPELPLEIITKSKWATASSQFGELGRFAKKVIVNLLRFYIYHQDIMNRYLLASNQSVQKQAQQQQTLVNELEGQMAFLRESVEALQTETQQGAEALQQTLVNELEGQIVSLREHVVALQTETQQGAEALQHNINLQLLAANQSVQEQAQQTASLGEHVVALQTETQQRAEALQQEMSDQKMRFAIRPYMQMSIFSSNGCGRKHSLGYESSSLKPHEQFDYLGFEEVFRGAESFIKERQSVYLRFFTDKKLVLDVGCGRGEFLELLTEAGIKAIGVDSNPDMARRCVDKGLTNVLLQDCNQYLSSSEEKNVDGIFSAQFIEHLPFEALYKFLTLSREKLAPGGVFIAETVNPHSIEAMKTFYVDLTHVKPLFPEVVLFLCRSAGFSKAEIFYPNGYGFSEEQYWLQGEYAVIAWK